MRSRVIALFVAAIMVTVVIGLAFASEGNPRKGKYLYRKNCRTCHGQTASDLSPNSKTQAEWKTIFASPEAIPCHDQWPELSEQDQADIFTYLHDFAKDSPTPAKCS